MPFKSISTNRNRRRQNRFDINSYTKNVLRSVKYIGVESLKGINPTLISYAEENVDLAKDVFSTAKEFTRSPKNAIEKIIGKENLDIARETGSNILSDIRTGKFYNPEREAASMDNYLKNEMGLDFSFDDMDFDVDEDFGEGGKSSSSGNDKATVNAITNSGYGNQMVMASGFGELSRSGSRNTNRNIKVNAQLFGMVNNSLSAINASILSMHNDLAKPLDTHIQNSTEFYKYTSEQLAKQTGYLENINRILTERFEPPKQSNGFGGATSVWDSVVGSNGLLDLRKFGSHIKKKALDESSLGMLTDMLNPDLLKQLQSAGGLSSPIAFFANMALSSALQNTKFGKQANRTNDILSSAFIKLFGDIHAANIGKQKNRKADNYGKLQSTGIAGYLLNLFDIFPDERSRAKFNNSKYNKGRADWTGKDQKALREVIPTQLAEIIHLLSGQETKIYDYESGTFKTRKSIYEDFRKDYNKSIEDSSSKIRTDLKNEFIDEWNTKANDEHKVQYNSRIVRNYEEQVKEIFVWLQNKGVIGSNYTEQDIISLATRTHAIKSSKTDNIGLFDRVVFLKVIRRLYKKNGGAEFTTTTLNVNRSAQQFIKNSTENGRLSSTIGLNSLESPEDKKNGGTGWKNSKIPGTLGVTDELGHNVFFYLREIADNTNGLGSNKGNRRNNRRQRTSFQSTVTSRNDEYERNIRVYNTGGKRFDNIDSTEDYEDLDYNSDRNTQLYDETNKEYHRAGEEYVGDKDRQTHRMSLSTVESRNDKKEKGGFFGNLMESINNGLSNVLLGTDATAQDRRAGLVGVLDKIQSTIVDFKNTVVDTIKDFFKNKIKKWWDEFKEGEFATRFKQSFKDTIHNGIESIDQFTGGKIRGFTNWIGEVTNANRETSSGSAFNGGKVTKTGMISVHEGERIIPAWGNRNKQKREEKAAYNNWIANGSPNLPYWGSYAEGGQVSSRSVKSSAIYLLRTLAAKKGGKLTLSDLDSIINDKHIKGNLSRDDILDIAKEQGISVIKSTVDKGITAVKEYFDYSETGKASKEFLKQTVGQFKRAGQASGRKGIEISNESKAVINEARRAIKDTLPESAAKGVLGALAGGALTGSGLGLLGGFIIGAGINVVKNSDKIQRAVFGEYDEKGNQIKKGVLPPEVGNFIKTKVPNMAKSGVLGVILGAATGATPGGLLGSFAIGAGLELLLGSKTVQDTAANMLFGHPDAQGNRNGGIVGSLRVRVVDPLADFVQDIIDNGKDYLKKNFIDPLVRLFNPLGDWAANFAKNLTTNSKNIIVDIGKHLYNNIDSIFDRSISRLLGGIVGSGKKVAEIAGSVASAPFKLAGKLGDKINADNLRKGYSSKNIMDRMEDITNSKKLSKIARRGTNAAINYTTAAANLYDETPEGLQKQQDYISDIYLYSGGLVNAQNSVDSRINNMEQTAYASLKNGGMGKDASRIRKELSKKFKEIKKSDNPNDYSSVLKYIDNLDSDMMSDEMKASLKESMNESISKITDTREKIANFDSKQMDFWKEHPELGVYKNGKIDYKQLNRISHQATTDFNALSVEQKEKENAKFNDIQQREANAERQATENPLDKQMADSTEKSANLISNIFDFLKARFGDAKEIAGNVKNAVGEAVSENPNPEAREQFEAHVNANKFDTDEPTVADLIEEEQAPSIRSLPNELRRSARNNINKLKNITTVSQTSDAVELLDIAQNEQGNSSLVRALNSAKSKASNAIDKITHEKGDKKEINGKQYEWNGSEWELDMSDESTRNDVKNEEEDRSLRNKFFNFVLGGGLLAKVKDVFGIGQDKNGEKKETIFDKLKNILFGDNGLLGGIGGLFAGLTGFLTGHLGEIILGALGLAGITHAVSSVEERAGTSSDSGMRNDKTQEERANEIAHMGFFGKLRTGLNNVTVDLTNKNMMAYSSDDYVSPMLGDRTYSSVARTALSNLNPAIAARNAAIISNTVGRIPRVGKAAATAINGITNPAGVIQNTVGKAGGLINYGKDILFGKVVNPDNMDDALDLLDYAQNGATRSGGLISKISAASDNLTTRIGQSGLGDVIEGGIRTGRNALTNLGSKVSSMGTAAASHVDDALVAASQTRVGAAAINAGSTVGNATSTIVSKIANSVHSVFEWVCKKLGVAVENAAPLATQFGEKLAKFGTKLKDALPVIGQVIYVAQILLAAEDGFEKAGAMRILGIIDEPTIPQRILAGALNAINYALPLGGLIPTETILDIVMGILEKVGVKFGNLTEQRKKAKETLDQYKIDTNNQGATLSEYIHNEMGLSTTQDKIKGTIGKAFTTVKEKVTGVVDDIHEGISGFVSGIVNGVKSVAGLVTSNAGYVLKGDVTGLWSNNKSYITTAASDEKQSDLGLILKTALGGLEVVTLTVPTAVVGIVRGIGKAIGTVVGGIGETIKTMINVSKDNLTAMRDGDLSALLNKSKTVASLEDENGNATIGSTLAGILDGIQNTYLFVPTALQWTINKVADTIKGFVSPIVEKLSKVGTTISKIWAYADEDANIKDIPNVIKSEAGDSPIMSVIGYITGLVTTIFHVVNKVSGWLTDPIGHAADLIRAFANSNSANRSTGTDSASGSNIVGGNSGAINPHTVQTAKYNCGPAAAATVLKTYGKNSNINQTQNYALANGYVAGASEIGTKAAYFGDILGANGIKTKYSQSRTSMANAINSGKPTILLGQDKNNRSKSNSPFGPNNHYIVARGSDSRGNIIVDDSELGATAKYPKSILNNAKLGIMTGGASGTYTPTGSVVSSRGGYNSGALTPTGTTHTQTAAEAAEAATSTASATTIDNTDRHKVIWDFLKSKGLSDYAAAGIMGCWEKESTNDPTVVEGFYYTDYPGESTVLASKQALSDYTSNILFKHYDRSGLRYSKSGYKGSDGLYYPGFGLAQWTGPRAAKLINTAESNGSDWRGLASQLNWFYSDEPGSNFANSSAKTKMETANNVEDATATFLDLYEMGGASHGSYHTSSSQARSAYSQRVGKAREMYNKYSGSAITTDVASYSDGINGNSSGFDNTVTSTNTPSSSSSSGSSSSSSSGTDVSSIISGIFSKIGASLSGTAGALFKMIFGTGGDTSTNSTNSNEGTQFSSISDGSSSTGSSGSTSESDAIASVNVTNGANVNGFPYYSQAGSPWGQAKYGEFNGATSYTAAGCAPSSLAMVAKSFGIDANPMTVGEYAVAHGFRTGLSGTSHGLFADYANANGLRVANSVDGHDSPIGESAVSGPITSELKAGHPVIANMTSGHFTRNGHFITLVGTDGAGNIYVNDPGKMERTSHSWRPSNVFSSIKNWWSFTNANGQGSIDSSKITHTVPSLSGSAGGLYTGTFDAVSSGAADDYTYSGTPGQGGTAASTVSKVQGYPYYGMSGGPWKDSTIPGGYTIGSSGCLVTSLASVAESFGIHKNPAEIAELQKQTGGYAYKAVPAKLGISVANQYSTSASTGYSDHGPGMGASHADEVLKEMDAGRAVIFHTSNKNGKHVHPSNSHFTTNQHWILGVGHDSEGNIFINDPAGASGGGRNHAWKAADVLNSANLWASYTKDGKGAIGDITNTPSATSTAGSKMGSGSGIPMYDFTGGASSNADIGSIDTIRSGQSRYNAIHGSRSTGASGYAYNDATLGRMSGTSLSSLRNNSSLPSNNRPTPTQPQYERAIYNSYGGDLVSSGARIRAITNRAGSFYDEDTTPSTRYRNAANFYDEELLDSKYKTPTSTSSSSSSSSGRRSSGSSSSSGGYYSSAAATPVSSDIATAADTTTAATTDANGTSTSLSDMLANSSNTLDLSSILGTAGSVGNTISTIANGELARSGVNILSSLGVVDSDTANNILNLASGVGGLLSSASSGNIGSANLSFLDNYGINSNLVSSALGFAGKYGNNIYNAGTSLANGDYSTALSTIVNSGMINDISSIAGVDSGTVGTILGLASKYGDTAIGVGNNFANGDYSTGLSAIVNSGALNEIAATAGVDSGTVGTVLGLANTYGNEILSGGLTANTATSMARDIANSGVLGSDISNSLNAGSNIIDLANTSGITSATTSSALLNSGINIANGLANSGYISGNAGNYIRAGANIANTVANSGLLNGFGSGSEMTGGDSGISEEQIEALVAYAKVIAENTSNNAAIPNIIKILSSLASTMSTMNSNTNGNSRELSEKTSQSISSIMSKLDSISKSL